MDVFIPVVFPDYKIAALGTRWGGLGHAGILFIHGRTGTAKYYEYGRYDKAGKGEVRKRTIPDVRVDKSGRIDPSSLAAVLQSIATQAGHGTRIEGAYIEAAGGFQKALDYVAGRKKQNADPGRKAYGLLTYNCGTFMQQTLEAAGVDTPWMIDPRPASYIKELRDNFTHLDYDPRSHKLTIGD
jgi:hypothetical protein